MTAKSIRALSVSCSQMHLSCSQMHLRKPRKPSERLFMTAVLTFDDQDSSRTKCAPRIWQSTEADREAHEKMGFPAGWAMCVGQLAEVPEKL
jgi:uncharacterized protein YndB with AHSA1/START domain